MTDDDPKKLFNDNGKPNFRDKDNAGQEFKPQFSSRPANNLAPPGMKGIHLSRYDGPQPKKRAEQNQEQVKSIVKTHPRPELLTGGRFLDSPGSGFAVEVSPYRSFAGLEGGRIDTLEIQKDGKILAQYQKLEWTVRPKDEETAKQVQRLQDQFGDKPKAFKPIVPIMPLDQGRDR